MAPTASQSHAALDGDEEPLPTPHPPESLLLELPEEGGPGWCVSVASTSTPMPKASSTTDKIPPSLVSATYSEADEEISPPSGGAPPQPCASPGL